MPADRPTAVHPLRISDLVPLRRMLGTDSVVIRVNADGTFAPLERLPMLFFEAPIRQVLAENVQSQFAEACARAIAERTSISFRGPGQAKDNEVVINPILDDDGDDCRFLVCWARRADALGTTDLGWQDFKLDDVIVRYRTVVEDGTVIVEASPWWVLKDGEVLELWPHHSQVAALGLGHAVMETLIYDAAEAAGGDAGGPAVRIDVPSAEMLAGLVPVAHAAVRASGLEPSRMIIVIPVELAVDQDLLPVIVHLRTLGMQIDIVGLDELTATLHTVSERSRGEAAPSPCVPGPVGAWSTDFSKVTRSPS